MFELVGLVFGVLGLTCGVCVSCWCWREVYIIYYITLLYYITIILLLYLILYSSILLLFPSSVLFPSCSSHLLSPSKYSFFLPSILPPPNSLIQSIRVGIWVHLLIFQTHPTIRPRMFYRSGWLRCVGLNTWGSCLRFELMFGVLRVFLCFECFGVIVRQLCGLFSVKVDFWRKVRYSSLFSGIWCFDPACFIGVDGWGV